MFDFTQGVAALLFVIPGYVISKVISMSWGIEEKSAVGLVIRSIFLSAISYTVTGPIYLWWSPTKSTPPWLWFLGSVVLLLVIPAILGFLYLTIIIKKRLVGRLFWRFKVPYNEPIPSAWDCALRENECELIRITLKDGTRIGGQFGEHSYGTTYPNGRDIYVEQAWKLDDDGNLLGPFESVRGVWVSQEEIQYVEFLKGGADDDEKVNWNCS